MSGLIEAPAEVAVIGMAGRFPGAGSLEAFWRNLREGIESISFFSDEELREAGIPAAIYGAPNYVKAHGVIDGAGLFDAGFFGYSPREAEVIDPQQRVFLECAWEAVEDAGQDPARLRGPAGVYAGVTLSSYLLHLHPLRDRLRARGIDATLLSTGNDKDSLATRVSYKLDLRGPAMTVQTACSSSLVAVHMACQSLLSEETDLALAGGVSITLPQNSGYFHEEGGILSPDGHCRAFDARAAGVVFGCGVGIVVLKRLADALADGDAVRAVIKGSAVNNDGATKAGFLAPSVSGQAEVIAEALADAGIDAGAISYVEAHGTATALGDPVEVAALTRAFRRSTPRRSFCALGSVKTNIGHLECAAGISGMIKTVLALQHGEIPPSLHYTQPNPQIDFEDSPFYVNDRLAPWTALPRRAGVSSFGFGGTNVHVILEEAPPPPPSVTPVRPWHLLVLSGRSRAALAAASRNLAEYLERNPGTELADVAYTLQVGRRAFEHRRAVACRTVPEAVAALSGDAGAAGVDDGRPRPAFFLFTGQGAQHPGMSAAVYRSESVFRELVDRCAALFQPRLGLDLRDFLLDREADAEAMARTEIAQPALFTVGYALAGLWQSWGVEPRGMIGHSLGEYVAACLAGVFTLEDAASLVAARGRLMQGLPSGDMLAVPIPEEELLPLLGDDLALAAVHGPDLCLASGPAEAIERLRAELIARDVQPRRLRTSHAFHSAMMDPILEAFTAEVRKVRLSPPRTLYVSDVTGRWISPSEATDPAYWSRHLRQTVRLADGLGTLLANPGAILLEVGPGQALGAAARSHPAWGAGHAIHSSLAHPKDPRGAADTADAAALMEALGGLWAAGVAVDWEAFHAGERRRRIPLPTYPFERRRYWIDFEEMAPAPVPLRPALEPEPAAPASSAGSYVDKRYAAPLEPGSYLAPRNELEEVLADMWQTLLGVERVGVHDNFFRLYGNSLTALQVLARVQSVFGVRLSVRTFFESPTVAELAEILAERLPGPEELAERARLLEQVFQAPAPAPEPQPERPEPVVLQFEPAPLSGNGKSPMRFSLFFFSGDENLFPEDKYRLIIEGARFADRMGFDAIWTPERHFHSFGGLYPNPSVLSSALAMVTERLQLRAGSVVLPLHHPVRVAEEWSVVDNLSRGRVGLSFASGFHPNDFIFAPRDFPERRKVMFERIDVLRRLWRGEKVAFPDGGGGEVEVEIFPKPVQPEVPIWVTCANTPDTFITTGRIGANVLTSLIGMSLDKLRERIDLYRDSLARHGHDPGQGQVAVMIHTFVGADLERVKEKVRGPFCHYLRSHTELLSSISRSLHKGFDRGTVSPEDLEELLQMEFERYFHTGSLLGTPGKCLEMVRRLREVGVDEVGCLLDFGVDVPSVMESLSHLGELRCLAAQDATAAEALAG
ncbi:MAG TPA: MupA/Atu3671 family FMN-dependent luciferase-like monooxygenase [Thermoanaerobaculia bacterium]|nr:MupA/Atu3671 family FMN-dependent luciferase-like monooxygenase [Thermoanaerobaculia bacterium]